MLFGDKIAQNEIFYKSAYDRTTCLKIQGFVRPIPNSDRTLSFDRPLFRALRLSADHLTSVSDIQNSLLLDNSYLSALLSVDSFDRAPTMVGDFSKYPNYLRIVHVSLTKVTMALNLQLATSLMRSSMYLHRRQNVNFEINARVVVQVNQN